MNRRVLMIIGVFVVIIATAAFLYTRTIKKPGPSPTVPSNVWQGITPGISSVNELYDRLGQPKASTQSATGTTLMYQSTNKYWTNDVDTTNNTVVFIKERVFAPAEISLKKRLSNLGAGVSQLYGPDSINQMYLYVYPSLGIALYGDPDHDIVYEVWYFAPTSLQGFLVLPEAQGFSTSSVPASGSL